MIEKTIASVMKYLLIAFLMAMLAVGIGTLAGLFIVGAYKTFMLFV